MRNQSPSPPSLNHYVMKNHHYPMGLGILSIFATLLVLLPMLAILVLAFAPSENIWPHMLRTTFPRYFGNTLVLMFGVGVSTAILGTITAWLSLRFSFWGQRVLTWALLLPLAVPGYLSAYGYVELLEYSGVVQRGLRDIFGFQTARDYWFPSIRSLGGAIFVLSLSLYPYVYLLARTAMKEQARSFEDAALSLGQSTWSRLWRVSLPMARPAIVVGAAIAMMEAASDYGTVAYFSVQTMTTGIFSTWLETNNASGAAQLAFVVLMMIAGLLVIERHSRRKMQFFNTARNTSSVPPSPLRGAWALGAFCICAAPVIGGFGLPVILLLEQSLNSAQHWQDPELWRAFFHTVFIGFCVALSTCAAAVILVTGLRHLRSNLAKLSMPILGLGYAAPGAVLGLGALIFLASFDHKFADFIETSFGYDPGLLFTGTSFAIIYALFVRFFAIPLGSFDAGFSRIAPNLGAAAQSLGRSRWGILREIEWPLMRGAAGAAFLLVFVDSVKELPATLLLRPFNYETLATRAHSYASLEDIANAAPAALFIAATGVIAVLVLVRRLG